MSEVDNPLVSKINIDGVIYDYTSVLKYTTIMDLFPLVTKEHIVNLNFTLMCIYSEDEFAVVEVDIENKHFSISKASSRGTITDDLLKKCLKFSTESNSTKILVELKNSAILMGLDTNTLNYSAWRDVISPPPIYSSTALAILNGGEWKLSRIESNYQRLSNLIGFRNFSRDFAKSQHDVETGITSLFEAFCEKYSFDRDKMDAAFYLLKDVYCPDRSLEEILKDIPRHNIEKKTSKIPSILMLPLSTILQGVVAPEKSCFVDIDIPLDLNKRIDCVMYASGTLIFYIKDSIDDAEKIGMEISLERDLSLPVEIKFVGDRENK